jgi:hypothetical protein
VAVSLRTLNVGPGGRAEHGDSADIVEASRTALGALKGKRRFACNRGPAALLFFALAFLPFCPRAFSLIGFPKTIRGNNLHLRRCLTNT